MVVLVEKYVRNEKFNIEKISPSITTNSILNSPYFFSIYRIVSPARKMREQKKKNKKNRETRKKMEMNE